MECRQPQDTDEQRETPFAITSLSQRAATDAVATAAYNFAIPLSMVYTHPTHLPNNSISHGMPQIKFYMTEQ